MATKIKPCNDGGKHKWLWQRNYTAEIRTIATRGFSLKGLYRCEKCGASKTAEAKVN